MATTNVYATLEAAKVVCNDYNNDPKHKDKKSVYAFLGREGVKVFTVAPNNAQARNFACLAWGIEVDLAENPTRKQKSVTDLIATASPEELETIRAILAKLSPPAPPAIDPSLTPEEHSDAMTDPRLASDAPEATPEATPKKSRKR